MSEQHADADSRLAIVDTPFDCDESERPFGKRWRQERITLTEEHLAALRKGKRLALDVQGEYVVYLGLDTANKAHLRELGYGG